LTQLSRTTLPIQPVEAVQPGRLRVVDRVSRRIRKPFRRHPWVFEAMLFAIALVIYQVSRAVVVGDAGTAFRNAADIVHWEKASGLFFEINLQQAVLTHLNLTKVLNYFYLYGHWTVTPIFFVWIYRNRRGWYPYIRNAFFAANAIALVCFVAFPVAPPRYFTGFGFVDTLDKISDINLHGGTFAGWFNPYAAVPSMHFGYSLMIGVAACLLLRSWPLRLIVLLYPAFVFVAITATANHYVLDSVAGTLVIGVGFVGAAAWMRYRGTLSPAFARARARASARGCEG
jgi:PAP2 superfamily